MIAAHLSFLGSGVPYMVRLRPPGLGVKGGPQRRVPIATGPPPGYAASAGARSELAMDCPRGLPTFFQYGAGTSGAAAAPRVPAPGAAAAPQVPAPGAAAARPGCRGAAPEVPRRHPRCRGGTSGAAAAPRVPGGGSSGAAAAPGAGTSGAAAAPQTCAAARARVPECRRARLPAVMASGKRSLTQMVQQATSDASSWLDVHADDVQPDAQLPCERVKV